MTSIHKEESSICSSSSRTLIDGAIDFTSGTLGRFEKLVVYIFCFKNFNNIVVHCSSDFRQNRNYSLL